ncbi:hypothetical protein [Vagococcus fluvialis]|uniref:hypothetical protein n=1 Tax=Vagococcus fluvialis TaxID=2738 RepID=UPI003B212B88
MEELYQEMRNLSLKLKEQTENELLNNFNIGPRELSSGLKSQEQQDKNYNQDLNLENFYLAIKLLLMSNTKSH